MNAKDAIKGAMDFSTMVFKGYLSDLEDAEIMKRPGKDCNHLAWQAGHLIASEVSLLESICPGKGAELPEGFADAHSKECVGSDDASKFHSTGEYLALMDQVREATVSALDGMTDEQLDEPAPEHFQAFCPTVGHMFILIGTHPMMHAGQLVPIRRELGKPILF